MKYIIIQWPESQHLFELPEFESNCHLINDDKGLDLYGSSAYFVNEDWYYKHKHVPEFTGIFDINNEPINVGDRVFYVKTRPHSYGFSTGFEKKDEYTGTVRKTLYSVNGIDLNDIQNDIASATLMIYQELTKLTN